MASLNKVILIGRLGRDPEVITFENGNRKITATLATSERYRDRENNWVEQTEWHNIVVTLPSLANDIADHKRNYSKGDLMYVEGKLKTRQYTDQQGNTRTITEINADRIMQLAPARPPQQSSNQGYPTSAQNVSMPTDPFADINFGNDGLPF